LDTYVRPVNVLILVWIQYEEDVSDEGVEGAGAQALVQLVEYAVLRQDLQGGEILLVHALGRLGLVALQVALPHNELWLLRLLALLTHALHQGLYLLGQLESALLLPRVQSRLNLKSEGFVTFATHLPDNRYLEAPRETDAPRSRP
jgi:hypothetical protein